MSAPCENMKNTLTDFLLGTLDQQQSDVLTAHITSCASCADYLKALENQKANLNRLSQTIDAEMPARIDRALKALNRSAIEQKSDTVSIWRTIMKSRITKLATAAAIILVAMVLIYSINGTVDITTPAFAIDDVINAMDNAEWMHMKFETKLENVEDRNLKQAFQGQPEIWQALHPSRHIIILGNGRIEFREVEAGKKSIYDPNINTITVTLEQSSGETSYPNMGKMLLTQIAELEKAGAAVERTDIVYEGKPAASVSIDHDLNGGRLEMSLVVDPHTHLPLKMKMRQTFSDGEIVTLAGACEYPSSGPADIYEAGAPRDAKIEIIDKRPDAEFLEAIKPFNVARDGLPSTGISISFSDAGKGSGGASILYADKPKKRMERRSGPQSKPATEDFAQLLMWAQGEAAESVTIDLYDGEYLHHAQRDYEGKWSVREKKYWRTYYLAGLFDAGWLRLPDGKVVANDYATENNLVCIEISSKAEYRQGKFFQPAERILYYLDPAHDYMVVRREQFKHRIPPYNNPVDPNTLDFDVETTPSEPYEIVNVVEFGRTHTGHEYPKKTEETGTKWRNYGAGWRLEPYTKTEHLSISLDTELPDPIFDANTLIPENAETRAPGEKTEMAKARDEAIAVIDSLPEWPEPEEIVNQYWKARKAKAYEKMAILWPGSSLWNEGPLKEPVEYLFGKANPAVGIENTIIVPYATKSYYKERGTYNLTMWLTNKESKKGRYYIYSGN